MKRNPLAVTAPRHKPARTRHFAAISAAPITLFGIGSVPMKYFGRFAGLLVALFPLWSSAQTAPTSFHLRWVKEQPSVNGVWQIVPRSVAVDANGDVIVTIQNQARAGDSGSGFDWLTTKYSGLDGQVIWSKGLNGPADRRDTPSFVTTDAAGNVFVVGSSAPAADAEGIDDADFYTVKYAAADGAVLWEKRVNGPSNGPDTAYGAAVTSSGDVIVVGNLYVGSPTDYLVTAFDSYTVRYAGGTGAIVWERKFNGPADLLDGLYRVLVDSNDNVHVAGQATYSSVNSADAYAAKLAGANGQVIWENHSSYAEYESAAHIALDGSGNVVTLGHIVSGGLATRTAKLDAADGHLIWERVFKVRDDVPRGLGLGSDGSAFVSVSSRTADGTFEFYTAKYDSGTGTILWEKTYNDGPGVEDPRDLIMDLQGNPIVIGAAPFGEGKTYAISYNSLDGSVVWDKRFDNRGQPFTPTASGNPIALTPDNGVVVLGSSYYSGLDRATVMKLAPAGRLLNIATRMKVETGDNVLIAGFIITGSQPKKVIIRGIAPSLPFSGVLADPTLNLDNGAVTNDNWRTSQEQEIIATTIPPSNNLESAIVATLAPGPHTAILAGVGGATGIGVVEVYDLDSVSPVQLANISSRGRVQTGDNVMIGGFIIGGDYSAKVLIRAIGPSLPFSSALGDPTLELVDKNGNRISNDNWRDTQEAEIAATTIPPTHENEAAIVATLVPGAYTAIVRGKDDTTGIAVVEAYNLQ